MVYTPSYAPLHSDDNLPLRDFKSKPSPSVNPQHVGLAPPQNWSFILRWVAFVVCEAGFVLLGAYCIANPLEVRLPAIIEDQAKGIFTIFMIGWQTLCVLLISPLVSGIFSSEWHYQLRRTGSVLPQETDKVSRLTSDIFDELRHFRSPQASRTFRVAFFLSLMLMALKGTAPAAVGVSTVYLSFIVDISIANLSIDSGIQPAEDYLTNTRPMITRRAAIATHIEQLESTIYKYKSPPNMIVPAPIMAQSHSLNWSAGPITYRSDFGKFNFTCAWSAPEASEIGNGLITFGGYDWLIYARNTIVNQNYTTGIFPLFPVTYAGYLGTDFDSTIETTTSLFLFAGRNSTVGPKDVLDGFNLDNIPSTETFGPVTNVTSAPLISLLTCDPHFEMSVGDITVYPDGSLNVSQTGGSPVGNMEYNLTNFMFSTGMTDVVSLDLTGQTYEIIGPWGIGASQQATVDWFMNDISATLFTSNPSFGNSTTPYITTLPLDQITNNLNNYFLSATKAYSDGYTFHLGFTGNNIVPIPFYNNVTVKGSIELPTPAVVTNKLVYYLTCFEVAIITILTPFMYQGWKRGKAYPFSFESLVKAKLVKE